MLLLYLEVLVQKIAVGVLKESNAMSFMAQMLDVLWHWNLVT